VIEAFWVSGLGIWAIEIMAAGGVIFSLLRQSGLILLLGLFACSGSDEKEDWQSKKKADPVTVVEVEELGTGTVSGLLLANAVVESESEASLFPAAGGTVIAIHRDEGDAVRKGELLAVLENVSLDANAERARSELARLDQQVQGTRELFERGVVSRRELEDLEHQLATARTSNREASSSFGETRLVAPFTGVVATRDIRVGEYAGASTAAFRVVDLTALRVVASLPERDLGKVKVGQTAKLISAYDSEVWSTGEVSRIAPIVDATSGTFRVTLSLDPNQETLRPGQFVSVELEIERRENVAIIPRRAVVYEEGRAVVYRMVKAPPPEDKTDEEKAEDEKKEESWFAKFRASRSEEAHAQAKEDDDTDEEKEKWIAERCTLERGLVDTVSVQVLSGVDIGDSIIIVGQANLRDGARVQTPEMSVAETDEKDPEDLKGQEDAE
jgi:membrane fusion protein (multidrug efflux system)